MSARAVLLASAIALGTAVQPAVPAASAATKDGCPPGIGIGLLQFPKERAEDPRAQTYVIDHVAPGATFRRQFQVCNGTGRRIDATLYVAGATVAGGSFLPAEGRTSNDISRAIVIEPSQVSLPDGEATTATAVFRVPRDAQPGEQYAVIFAEVAGEGPAVQARSRAGIRVYLDVGAGGERPSDFEVDSLQAVRQDDGTPAVLARVTNTGARALDLRGELTLKDGPGGLSGGPFPAQLGTTLGVGQSGPVTIPLDAAIRGGPWLAALTLQSGTLERRAEGRIIFPEQAGQQNAPVKAKNLPLREDPNVVIPIAVGIFGLAVLLLLFALYRRRNKDEDDEQQVAR